MKYILLFYWILVSAPTLTQAQPVAIPDSSRMCTLLTYLDTVKLENIMLFPVHTVMDGYTIDSRVAFLAAHAKVFDFLLLHGLDINFDIKANPLVIYSEDILPEMMTKEFFQERAMMHERIQRYNLFRQFIDVKEPYETRIRKKFYAGDTGRRQLETDVAAVVRYSGLAFPQMVQDILLLKYRHLKKF